MDWLSTTASQARIATPVCPVLRLYSAHSAVERRGWALLGVCVVSDDSWGR